MSLADQIEQAASVAGSTANSQPTSLADQIELAAGGQRKQDLTVQPASGSATDNFLAGVGHGMIATGQNVKQGFDKLANSLESSVSGTPVGDAISWANKRLGLDSASDILANTNSAIEQRKIDAAPLLKTQAGKIGNFAGTVATAAPTMLIPGANTYTGAGLIGAGTGLATSEGGLIDRLQGAAAGAVGGIAGKSVGDLIGAGISKLSSMRSNSLASEASANAQKDAAINLASQHGYKLPPQDVNPGAINAALEGISGKIKTSQAASQANQNITNGLVKKALGISEDAPITTEALQSIRQQAGDVYNMVRNTGVIKPGQAYQDALDSISNQANGQARSFPGLKNDQISEVINTLKQPEFQAGDAVDATKFLRGLADKAYASGDKATGGALKQASGALEDALDGHLQSLGQPEALAAFRDARQTIAKTYSVEKALNPTTGNIDASKLAQQLQRGKPLSGELRDVASVNRAFPKATQTLKQNYNPSSPLDFATAVLSQGGKAAMVLPLARPATRAMLLSGPIQRLNTNLATDYSGGVLSNGIYPALSSQPLRSLLRINGTVGAIDAAK